MGNHSLATTTTSDVVPAALMAAVFNVLKVVSRPRPLEEFVEAVSVAPSVAALHPTPGAVLEALRHIEEDNGGEVFSRFVLSRRGQHAA